LARLSCSNYGYREWRLKEIIPSIARIGYGAVEVVTHGLGWPTGFHLNPDFDQGYVGRMMEALEAHRVKVSCISPGNDFIKPTRGSVDEEIGHVNRNVDLAVRVGAPCVRIQATALRDVPAGFSRERFIRSLAEPLGRCVDYAGRHGVKLAIETHVGFWAAVTGNMADLLEAVGSPYLGICLHTDAGSLELVKSLGAKVFHTHLSESLKAERTAWAARRLMSEGLPEAEAAAKLGVTQDELKEALAWKPREVHLGEGDIPFRGILAGLRDAGYQGWWNFEGHSTVDPEKDAEAAFNYLTALLKELGIP